MPISSVDADGESDAAMIARAKLLVVRSKGKKWLYQLVTNFQGAKAVAKLDEFFMKAMASDSATLGGLMVRRCA